MNVEEKNGAGEREKEGEKRKKERKKLQKKMDLSSMRKGEMQKNNCWVKLEKDQKKKKKRVWKPPPPIKKNVDEKGRFDGEKT